MALFEIHCVDEQIKALPTVSTASGSVATFDTDMQENLIEVVCDIQYQQASGTPSPSNPLPITVYTSLNLSHSGADTSNPTVYNIPFGQTVAKGTMNVTTGVLEITHGVVDLGSLAWSTDGQGYAQAVLSNIKPTPTTTDIAPIKCDKLLPDTQAHVYAKTTDNTVSGATSAQVRVYMTSLVGLNNTQVKSALEGFILVYELATPTTIQLSATQITALLNENNIWCDTGNTSVKYILSVGKVIS